MIRVLIVDDSITIRKTVATYLCAAGMEVVGEAANGLEAVAVGGRSRDGDEEVAGLYRSRVGRYAGDLDLGVSLDRFLFERFRYL